MTILLAIIRALHFGASLLPLSVFATMLFVVNPAARRSSVSPETGGAAKHFLRQMRYIQGICLILFFLSGFFWLWFSIAGMSGSSLRESFNMDLFKMVLTQTPPGHVWLLRVVIGVLSAGAAIPIVAQCRFKTALLCLCALPATCLAGSLAWLGHAGATEWPLADIHLAADVLHLLSAAVWPCGLLPFVFFIRLLLKSREPGLHAIARIATRRFSSISLVAVGFLAASGGVNSFFLVGNFYALFSTGYGRLLLVKLAFFAAMIAIGAINLLSLKPRLSHDTSALKQIARNVYLELCLGVVVLLIVGLLGITAPALHP